MPGGGHDRPAAGRAGPQQPARPRRRTATLDQPAPQGESVSRDQQAVGQATGHDEKSRGGRSRDSLDSSRMPPIKTSSRHQSAKILTIDYEAYREYKALISSEHASLASALTFIPIASAFSMGLLLKSLSGFCDASFSKPSAVASA